MDFPSGTTLMLIALAWLAFACWCWRVERNPRGDILSGVVWWFAKIYTRVFHRLKIVGRHHVPLTPHVLGRPVVIVANHTAGLDPVLIQVAVPFFVRWFMAEDMRGKRLEGLWEFLEIIMLDRSGRADHAAFRTAIGAMKGGSAFGIFPEGKLRRHRRELNPFLPGVGLLISRSDAVVLPAVITGTPHCRSSWRSLFVPSRSRIEFKPLIDPRAQGLKASTLPGHLQQLYTQWLTELGEPPLLAEYESPVLGDDSRRSYA